MAVQSWRRTTAALSTDTGTVIGVVSVLPTTNRAVKCQEFSFVGLGTASAANEIQVAPGTTGTGTAVTNIAGQPTDPISSAAAGYSIGTTWGTAIPTWGANAGLAIGVNANGGVYRWLAKTNFELKASQNVPGSFGTLNWSCRSAGAGNVGFHVLLEEL